MKKISPLRDLAAGCLASFSLLLPGQLTASTNPNQWLEEGYTWSYTCRLCTDPGFDPVDDFVKIYRLEFPVEMYGESYFPLKVKFQNLDGNNEIPNYMFQPTECSNEYVIGYLRQNKIDGTVYYTIGNMPNQYTYEMFYLIQDTQTQIWDKLNASNFEYPLWKNSDYEFDLFGSDVIDIKCKTLVGERYGTRFAKKDYYAMHYEGEDSYVGYVDGLGRVGVDLYGNIDPKYAGDLLGTFIDPTTGWSNWTLTYPLLYSIQRGDGTYLVLNEENAPKRATDSLQGVGADDAGVKLTVGHNMLTVTAAAPAEVSIADLAGRVVAMATVEGQQQFNLNAGIYMVTVNGHTRKIAVK